MGMAVTDELSEKNAVQIVWMYVTAEDCEVGECDDIHCMILDGVL